MIYDELLERIQRNLKYAMSESEREAYLSAARILLSLSLKPPVEIDKDEWEKVTREIEIDKILNIEDL